MAALLIALRAEIQMATSGTNEAIQKLSENMATDRNFVVQWMKKVGDVVKELKEKSASESIATWARQVKPHNEDPTEALSEESTQPPPAPRIPTRPRAPLPSRTPSPPPRHHRSLAVGRTKDPKINAPTAFSGNSADLTNFFFATQEYIVLKTNELPDKRSRLSFITTVLTGKALDW